MQCKSGDHRISHCPSSTHLAVAIHTLQRVYRNRNERARSLQHTAWIRSANSAKPGQVVRELPPPPWPIVCYVMTPQIYLVWDALLSE